MLLSLHDLRILLQAAESPAYYSCDEHFSDIDRRYENGQELGNSHNQSSLIAQTQNHFVDAGRNLEGNLLIYA